MENEKKDMSVSCGFKDAEVYYGHKKGEITQEEHDAWFKENCLQCKHAGEICMFGEQE